MRSKTNYPKATFESAWALSLKNERETEKLREYLLESQKKYDKEREEREKERAEYKKQREMEWQKLREEIKAIHQEVGGIGQSNGEFAESYFINSLMNSMQFAGQEYDEFDYNLGRKSKLHKLQREYDIVMWNGNSAVLIEIKYKAREKDVIKMLKHPAVFKELQPQFANYDIYLGLAAFHFDTGIEQELLNQGIAVIKQVGETIVVMDERLKVF